MHFVQNCVCKTNNEDESEEINDATFVELNIKASSSTDRFSSRKEQC